MFPKRNRCLVQGLVDGKFSFLLFVVTWRRFFKEATNENTLDSPFFWLGPCVSSSFPRFGAAILGHSQVSSIRKIIRGAF